MTLKEAATVIKGEVSVREAMQFYTGCVPRFGRIPCPLHHGEHPNFMVNEYLFKCFVCGETGDVIGFVEKYFGMTFAQAIDKLNADFNLALPIGEAKVSLSEERAIAKRIAAYKARLEETEAEKARREEEYHNLWDAWIACDIARMTYPPDSDEYADAVKHIDGISYEIDMIGVQ